jgi:hypothetical protein
MLARWIHKQQEITQWQSFYKRIYKKIYEKEKLYIFYWMKRDYFDWNWLIECYFDFESQSVTFEKKSIKLKWEFSYPHVCDRKSRLINRKHANCFLFILDSSAILLEQYTCSAYIDILKKHTIFALIRKIQCQQKKKRWKLLKLCLIWVFASVLIILN